MRSDFRMTVTYRADGEVEAIEAYERALAVVRRVARVIDAELDGLGRPVVDVPLPEFPTEAS